MWKSGANDMEFADSTNNQHVGSGYLPEDATSGQTGNKGEVRESRIIVSVNVNQLHNLTTISNGLVLHQQKVSLVRFVGRLLSVNEHSTKSTYMVSDGTDKPIEVSLWKVSDNTAPKPSPAGEEILMENSYVRVIGQPRRNVHSPAPFVMALSVVPIETFNEYTVHLLEVLDNCNYLKDKKNQILSLEKGDFCSNTGFSSSAMAVYGGAPNDPKQGRVSGLSGIQQTILSTITECQQKEHGISRSDLHNTFKSMSPATIDDEITFLCSEGHIFTSLDDDHFKATDF